MELTPSYFTVQVPKYPDINYEYEDSGYRKPGAWRWVSVHAKQGEELIAHVQFYVIDEHLKAGWVEVDPKYRRMGIATEMYKIAQERSGLPIVKSGSQTQLGKAFTKDSPWTKPK